MTSPLPAHLSADIRHRIAWLREAWRVDEVFAPPQLTGYSIGHQRREPGRPGSSAPTFPRPHRNDARSRS
jgi:hypothetical protein